MLLAHTAVVWNGGADLIALALGFTANQDIVVVVTWTIVQHATYLQRAGQGLAMGPLVRC